MSFSGAQRHHISGVFVFLLMGLFALCATVMVLLGAKAYRGTAARAEAHGRERVAASYVRSMLRSDDEAGAVAVERHGDTDVIALTNTYDGEQFITRIYAWEGELREWFMSAAEPFDPEMGETVCPAETLEAGMEDGLLTVRILSGGAWSRVDCALRAAGRETP